MWGLSCVPCLAPELPQSQHRSRFHAQHLCCALPRLSVLPSAPRACPGSFTACCGHTGGVSMLMRGTGVPGQGQDGQAAQQLLLEHTPEVVSFPGGQASVTREITIRITITTIIIEVLCMSVCPAARHHGEQQEQAQRREPAAAQPGSPREQPAWGVPSLTDTQQGGCSRRSPHAQPLLRHHGRRVQALWRLQHL